MNVKTARSEIVERATEAFQELEGMDDPDAIEAINAIRLALHEYSPLKAEPVDCVIWVPIEEVIANDYNPNAVAPPEMELLRHSIAQDGYTQPIVAWTHDEVYEVVDGFHRNRVGRECEEVKERVKGYLPLTVINSDRMGRSDRIASTIRHNRARGKHKIDAMTDIVTELKRRNWSNNRIGTELGMDQDEVLRLCQLTGLTEMFGDSDFSKSWDIGIFDDLATDFIDDETGTDEDKKDANRIYHTWDKWECHKAGFYNTQTPDGMSDDEALEQYRSLLSDIPRFGSVLEKIITEWKHSCEHYLTNERMNRIAWLGQAALAYECHIPSHFRGGYNQLTEEQQVAADAEALKYLNKWLEANGRSTHDAETAESRTQANLY